jgi:hypothetical protein
MSNIQFSELLKQAVTESGILSKAYSAFHNYSIGNQMAAISQCTLRGIEPAPIATYKDWLSKGRQVKKGEKALTLCMPVSFKVSKENPSTGETEVSGRKGFIWKNNWFVLSQTDGEDFANEAKTPLWNFEQAKAKLEITETTFNLTNGNCQGYAYEKTIAINPVAVLPHKTRFHEMAHVVLGHTSEMMQDDEKTPTDIREVEAESVAYILCSILSLPGLAESRGYIQNWMRSTDIGEKSSQRIFSTANKILEAGKTE